MGACPLYSISKKRPSVLEHHISRYGFPVQVKPVNGILDGYCAFFHKVRC